MISNIFVGFAIYCLATGILAEDTTTFSPVSSSDSKLNDTTLSDDREGRIVENDKTLQDGIDTADNTIQTGKIHELDIWEAPKDIQRNFVYYHSGFDVEGRPIWSWELGKWNFRSVTDHGPEAVKNFDKFMDQFVHRAIKSIDERSDPDEPVKDLIVLIDMDEFNLIQMAHVPTVQLILRTLAKFRPIIDQYLYVGLVVNTNAAAQGLITLTRPVLGSIMERTEIFGTNKASWIPQVLKHIPKSQIPEWYGGSKSFKPLKVYG